MKSNVKMSSTIFLAVFGTVVLAFGLPFMLIGSPPERHDDIIFTPQFTATPTPLDRVLTQSAFAQLFFTPTNPPAAPLAFLASPTSELIIPVAGGNNLTSLPALTPVPLTNTNIPPTPTRKRAGDPDPTQTNTLVRPPRPGLPSPGRLCQRPRRFLLKPTRLCQRPRWFLLKPPQSLQHPPRFHLTRLSLQPPPRSRFHRTRPSHLSLRCHPIRLIPLRSWTHLFRLRKHHK